MKNFIEFLAHPLLHLVISLLLFLWIRCYILSFCDAFDSPSAFLGGLTVIVMNIFD